MRYLVLGMALLLTSCAATGSGDFCAVSRPIYISADDHLTDSTARQVLTHNRTYVSLCR